MPELVNIHNPIVETVLELMKHMDNAGPGRFSIRCPPHEGLRQSDLTVHNPPLPRSSRSAAASPVAAPASSTRRISTLPPRSTRRRIRRCPAA